MASSWSVPTQREIDLVARRLRVEKARSLAPSFSEPNGDRDLRIVARSPFSEHVEDYPHDNALTILAFNLSVTEAAIQELLRQEDQPARLAFIAARIVELGAQAFSDPAEPEAKPRRYLAIAKNSGYFEPH